MSEEKDKILTDGGQANPAQRGIINEEGKADRIPLIGWRKTDVAFIVGLTCVGFFIIGPQTGQFWIPVTAGCFGVSLFAIYLKPKTMSVVEAIKIGLEYIKEPSIVYAAGKDADSDEKNEGGLLNHTPFSPSNRSQEMANIELAFPDAGAVYTTDGRMETIIEVEGSNMDFAQQGAWANRQQVGKNYADRHIKDRAKLHATTRDFDFTEIVDRAEDRLEDEDIKHSKVAKSLINEYREKRPEQVDNRGTQQVHVYLVVSVHKKEVAGGRNDEMTAIEKAKKIPILGRVADRLDDDDGMSDEEEDLHQRLIEHLDEEAKRAQDQLIGETKGYDYRRLTTIEYATIASKLFNGRDMNRTSVENIMENSTPNTDDNEVRRITASRRPEGETQ